MASLTVSSTLFLLNANNFPVLGKAHQAVVRRLLGLHPIVTVVVCSEITESTGTIVPKLYADYLNHMFARRDHVGPLQEQFTFGYQVNFRHRWTFRLPETAYISELESFLPSDQ